MTRIQDTILYADGSFASGRIVLTWPPFQFGGVTIVGGQREIVITPNANNFDFSCQPTVGALPTNVYYTASYRLDRGPVYDEYWVVPSGLNTTIGAIRTIPEAPR